MWPRTAAVAPICPLPWELPYAKGADLKNKKKKKKRVIIGILKRIKEIGKKIEERSNYFT